MKKQRLGHSVVLRARPIISGPDPLVSHVPYQTVRLTITSQVHVPAHNAMSGTFPTVPMDAAFVLLTWDHVLSAVRKLFVRNVPFRCFSIPTPKTVKHAHFQDVRHVSHRQLARLVMLPMTFF